MNFIYDQDGQLIDENDWDLPLEQISGVGRSSDLLTGECKRWESSYVLLAQDERGKHYQKRWAEHTLD